MLDYRIRRVRPSTDTKVLTAWNALAISALAEAGTTLGEPSWVGAASEAMAFVLDELRVHGRLMRSYRKDGPGSGVVKHLGYCEDYAFVLEASLSLYEATFEISHLENARWAADECIRLFLDADSGGFYTTGSDGEQLVMRPKDLIDNAMPAANSVLALELQRLTHFTGDDTYAGHGVGILRLLRNAMAQSPLGFGHLLGALDFYTMGPAEIVVVGEPDADDTRALISAVHDRFRPNKVLIRAAESDTKAAELIPLLRDRTMRNGNATAFVCRDGTCKLPVDSVDALREQLP